MPPRRQQAGQPARTTTVRDIDHFDALRQGQQLCIAIYTDTTRPQLSIISRALAELSSRPEFAHVTFAEVDISVQATGDILEEQQVREIPKLQAWRSNELLMTSSGQPYFILEALKRHAGEPPPPAKKGRRWAKILLGAGLVAAAGLLAAYAQQRRGRDEDDDPQGLMQRIDAVARGALSQSELRVLKINARIQDLKQSVEVDMDAYRRERSMQEWEHFQGSTEEVKMDAFGRKLRDETRPDLDVLQASINRKMDTLQSLYKRERELARRLPEPEELESKGQEDFLRQGPWQWVDQHALPAMDDDLKKWGVSPEAVEGTYSYAQEHRPTAPPEVEALLEQGSQNAAASQQKEARPRGPRRRPVPARRGAGQSAAPAAEAQVGSQP